MCGDTVESCDAFLTKPALALGIDTLTLAKLAKIDKHHKHKGNNDDWQHPHDPDAKITKMKDDSESQARPHAGMVLRGPETSLLRMWLSVGAENVAIEESSCICESRGTG